MVAERRGGGGPRGGRSAGAGRRRAAIGRRKVCRFCADKAAHIDYKDSRVLSHFVTERGKIIPRRITGACARHQRHITTAVKRARVMALLPYTSAHE